MALNDGGANEAVSRPEVDTRHKDEAVKSKLRFTTADLVESRGPGKGSVCS